MRYFYLAVLAGLFLTACTPSPSVSTDDVGTGSSPALEEAQTLEDDDAADLFGSEEPLE